MRRTLLTLTAVSALVSGSAHPVTTGFNGGAQTTPIFRLQADGFWLNLHHFLYVLGRAEAQMPDRQRRAVAAAPRFDPLLTHALIFFTAGEAVRSMSRTPRATVCGARRASARSRRRLTARGSRISKARARSMRRSGRC